VPEQGNLNTSPQDRSTDFVYHFMQLQNSRQPSSGHVIGRASLFLIWVKSSHWKIRIDVPL